MTIKKQVLLDYGLNGVICLVYAAAEYIFKLQSWSYVVFLGLQISVTIAYIKHEKYQYDDEMSQSFKDKAGNKTIQTVFFAIIAFFSLDGMGLMDMTKISMIMDYRILLIIFGVLRVLYCCYYLIEEKKV